MTKEPLTADERRAVLAAGWIAACVDGEVHPSERRLLGAARWRVGVSYEDAALLEAEARRGALALALPGRACAREAMFDLVSRVVAADGRVSRGQGDLLRDLGRALGLGEPEVQRRLLRVREMAAEEAVAAVPPVEDPRGILERLSPERAAWWRDPSAWVLVGANLVPLGGVALAGWGAAEVAFLYWIETGFLTTFTLLKLIPAGDAAGEGGFGWRLGGLLAVPAGGTLFLIAHRFGLFAALGPEGAAVWDAVVRSPRYWISAGFLLGGHAWSFLWDYWRREEYERVLARELIVEWGCRLTALHAAVAACAWIGLRAPAAVLVGLTAVKSGVDVLAHRIERDRHR